VLFVPDALAKTSPPGKPPPPALSFSPQTSGSFDYGTVTAGNIASQDFTLTNGSGTSTTLAINLSGSSAFAIVIDGCSGISLPNGRSCVVVVSYASTTPSGDSATLTAAGVGKKAQPFPTSLALNGSGGVAHLYWSSQTDGWIRKANLDGSDVQVIVTDSYVANGMAVSSSHVYWTGGDGWCGSTIRAAKLDGSGEATVITGQNCAWGLAVDGSHLYWSTLGDGTLHRANLDGSGPVTLVTGQSMNGGVAVDSSHVYWAGFGGVYRANLDGSHVQLVASVYSACSVVVDDSHIYLGECNGNPVLRTDLDGSNAFYFPGVAAESLSLYGGRVYWASNASRIDVANVDGSNLGVGLFTGGSGEVNVLAVGGQ
jgi:hypothetical protein